MERLLGFTEADLIKRIRRLQELRADTRLPGAVQFYDATIETYRELLAEFRKRKLSAS